MNFHSVQCCCTACSTNRVQNRAWNSCFCSSLFSTVGPSKDVFNLQINLGFATWCIILLEVSIRIWVHCSHKGMDMVSNNIRLWCLNDAQLVLRAPKFAKKISPRPLHHHQPEPLRQGRMDKFKTLDKTNKINKILCRLHFYLLAFHQKCEQTVNISRERVGAE